MPRTGRPRTFDESNALEKITEVFWRHGYEAATMQQLGAAVGVLPGSLYGALGNKRSLFLEALKRYTHHQRALGQALRQADPVLPTLRQALTAVLTAAADAPGRGCLLGNSAVELLPADDDVIKIIADAFCDLEQAITTALENAQRRGEVRSGLDPGAQARMIVALMQGLHVIARAQDDPARLTDVVDAALSPLGRSAK